MPTTGVAEVFDLHALKEFAPDKRVRKMLMHKHPREEEAIFVLEGTATMSVGGEEVVAPAGSIVKFGHDVLHDVRNLGGERCVIMFVKVNPKVLRAGTEPADG